jgi:hypothetical protein
MVSFTPRPLYPQGKRPWYALDRRLDEPRRDEKYVQNLVGRLERKRLFRRGGMDKKIILILILKYRI